MNKFLRLINFSYNNIFIVYCSIIIFLNMNLLNIYFLSLRLCIKLIYIYFNNIDQIDNFKHVIISSR